MRSGRPPSAVINEDSEIGRRYIAAMQLAGRYSYAGREWLIERVRRIIGGEVTDMVHNHHTRGGRTMAARIWGWCARAQPRHSGASAALSADRWATTLSSLKAWRARRRRRLYSTMHGAGRLFGRREAKRRFTRAEMDAWLQSRGVTLVGADLDESPMAYRRLPEVLARARRLDQGAAHAASVRGGDGRRERV